MKKIFSDRAFNKKLFRLMLPIAFQYLMLSLVAVSDTFMLGNVSQNYMSGVSLATQIQFIQNMFLGAVTATVGILGSQYFGKGDRKSIEEIFALALKINGCLSIMAFVGCTFFPNYLMTIFTNDTEILNIGAKYLSVAGFSYFLTGISQCYLSIFKVTDHVKYNAIISSTAVVLNIVFNMLLIYGIWIFPELGVVGAAVATLISRIVELILCFIVSINKKIIRIKLKLLLSNNKALFVDFIKNCYPLLGAYLFWGVGFTSYPAFMGHLGADATAANSVTAVVRDVVCCVTDGFAAAAGIIVGNELGAGNLERGKLFGKRLLVISCICGVLSSIVLFAFSPLLISFVKLSDGAIYYLKGMLAIVSAYMIGRSINTIVVNGIFAAGGDTLFDMYSLAVSMWCLAVPLAFLGTFVFHWHPLVVYACTCLDEIGKIPWVIYHFRKYKWVKNLTR